MIEEYLNLYSRQKWSFSTYTTRTSLLNRYVLPQIGSVSLNYVTGHFLSRYFAKLIESEQHITTGVIYGIYKLLRNIFNQAVYWGIYEKNPIAHVAVSKPISTPLAILSSKQILHLIKTTSKDDQLLSLAVQMSFVGSLRKGELCALCWGDIDFENKCIYINKELLRVSNKSIHALSEKNILYMFPPLKTGSKSRLVIKTPKTSASIRKVYLPKSLLNELSEWRTIQYKTNVPADDYDFIFTNEKGYPLQPDSINKMLSSALAICDLPHVVFHSLRHSSSTYKLLISGGDIKSVQGDNGHAKPDMVLNVYAHTLDEQRKEIANQIEKMFYSNYRSSLD